ncbi:hypothetical protein LINPERHAP1_LOCUS9614 [Linum perenne]
MYGLDLGAGITVEGRGGVDPAADDDGDKMTRSRSSPAEGCKSRRRRKPRNSFYKQFIRSNAGLLGIGAYALSMQCSHERSSARSSLSQVVIG